MQCKIFVVEDEPDISGLLVKILEGANYRAVQAFSGTEAGLLLEKETPDLILLDLMLPGMSGEELLREIREKRHSNVPVLIISAKDTLRDKVALLQSGADDYITKPFEPEEVLARIQAALRRVGKELIAEKNLTYKNLKIYMDSRKVTAAGSEVSLTAREYDILCLFMQNPGKVYSRETLYEMVWHGGYYGENNTVNVHVSNLRKKLKEKDEGEDYIQTVYGIGFKLQ